VGGTEDIPPAPTAQQQYACMYGLLTEQIAQLKEQMLAKAAAAAVAQTGAETDTEDTLQRSAAETAQTAATALAAAAQAQAQAKVEADAKAEVALAAALAQALAERAPAPPVMVRGEVPVPVADPAVGDGAINPQGFENMTQVLLFAQSLQQELVNAAPALGRQLQSAQQGLAQAETKVGALLEELSSYQQYMRDIVPQYKKQLQALKQQLKRGPASKQAQGSQAQGQAAQALAHAHAAGEALKLPNIK